MKNLNMYQHDSDSHLKRLFQFIAKIGKPYESPPGFEYLRQIFTVGSLEMNNEKDKRILIGDETTSGIQ